MTAIVGVHGVGNCLPGQPAAEVAARRSADWAASVATGLGIPPGSLDLTVAYYAPILHAAELAAQAATDPDRALDTLDPDTEALARSWIEALDLPDVTVQGRLAVPLRHAVTAAAERFSLNGRVTKLFVAVCFPEVARHLAAGDAPARAQAREHVATVIAERQARIVIAHSLGTVVAYEALHAHPELNVDLLVTLGSPLALPGAVFPRLHPRLALEPGCARPTSGAGSTSATTATRSPSCGPSKPTSPVWIWTSPEASACSTSTAPHATSPAPPLPPPSSPSSRAHDHVPARS